MNKKTLTIIAFVTGLIIIGALGYFVFVGVPAGETSEESAPASDEPTSTPVSVAEIPATLFGLHYFYSDTHNPWPTTV